MRALRHAPVNLVVLTIDVQTLAEGRVLVVEGGGENLCRSSTLSRHAVHLAKKQITSYGSSGSFHPDGNKEGRTLMSFGAICPEDART
eukprot:2664416-Rhodomonas_salina.3